MRLARRAQAQYTSRTAMAAGGTPGIRAAWPKVRGRTRSSLPQTPRESPGRQELLKLVRYGPGPSARRNLSTWRSCCRTYPPYFASISILERTPRAGSSPTRQWPRPLTEARGFRAPQPLEQTGLRSPSSEAESRTRPTGTARTQQFHQPGLVLLLPREQRQRWAADQPDAMAQRRQALIGIVEIRN